MAKTEKIPGGNIAHLPDVVFDAEHSVFFSEIRSDVYLAS